MKKFIFFLLIGVLFLTAQATILASPVLQRIRPDLVLIFVLYLGLSDQPIFGGLFAFSFGFLMDIFSGNVLGLHALSRTLIFYLVQFLRGRIYLEALSSQFIFTFIFNLFEGLLLLTLLKILNPHPIGSLYSLWFTSFLLRSLFTALLGPPLFSLIERGTRRQIGAGEGG